MKREPWEIFYAFWSLGGSSELPTTGAMENDRLGRVMDAIRAAGRETTHHLRCTREWSLISSHVLARRLMEAAEDWVRMVALDRGDLQRRLRAVCSAERQLYAVEEESRRNTEGIFTGGTAGGQRLEAVCYSGAGEGDVFELYTW